MNKQYFINIQNKGKPLPKNFIANGSQSYDKSYLSIV